MREIVFLFILFTSQIFCLIDLFLHNTPNHVIYGDLNLSHMGATTWPNEVRCFNLQQSLISITHSVHWRTILLKE